MFRGFGFGFLLRLNPSLGCFEVSGFGFRVSGFGFRGSGFGFRVQGLGFRGSGVGVARRMRKRPFMKLDRV